MKNNSTFQQSTIPGFVLTLAGDFDGRRVIQPHAHPYTELVYVCRDECESAIGPRKGRSQRAGAGMAFLVPPLMSHDQRGPARTIFVGFHTSDDVGEPACIDLRNDPFVRRWLEDLVRIWRLGLHEEATALAYAIWRRCLRVHTQNATFPNQQSPRLADALTYISNHYSSPLTAREIAAQAQCSISTLNTCFRQQFHQSLMAYLYDFRLAVARKLLDNDYVSVKEIAARCGFADANYFIRAFRKRYGGSPGKLRKSSPAPLP